MSPKRRLGREPILLISIFIFPETGAANGGVRHVPRAWKSIRLSLALAGSGNSSLGTMEDSRKLILVKTLNKRNGAPVEVLRVSKRLVLHV